MLTAETGQRDGSPEETGHETCCARHLEMRLRRRECGALPELLEMPPAQPWAEGHHPHLAARDGTALKGLRGPMPGAPHARIPLRVLFQPLRMLSDKPPQTTSTGR